MHRITYRYHLILLIKQKGLESHVRGKTIQSVQFVLLIEADGISETVPTGEIAQFLHVLGMKEEQERNVLTGFFRHFLHYLLPTVQLQLATGTAHRIHINQHFIVRFMESEIHRILALHRKDRAFRKLDLFSRPFLDQTVNGFFP